jgi:hypothetical protein
MPAHPSSESKLIRSFYTRISENQSRKATQLYNDWKLHWEALHGPLGRKKSARKDVLAKRYGLPEEDLDTAALLYSIYTYYVVRLRLRAYLDLTERSHEGPVTGDQVLNLLNEILTEKTFSNHGVENFAGAELFGWVTDCADDNMLGGLRVEFQREFARQAAPQIERPRDDVRSLFQSLIPKQFRHSVGAHYTPDWLADYVLFKLEYVVSDSERTRLVDPHCGSGTFLIAALRRAYRAKQVSSSDDWHSLLSDGIRGFDVDPVAAIAAKTNLLSFVRWLISIGQYRIEKPLRLPIFLADTICSANNPSEPKLFSEEIAEQKQAGLFDYVVGNPPWVNWEYLPNSYKELIKPMWPRLGLVDFKGTDKAFSKVDLSVLATYVAGDDFLKPTGKLGFILPQSIFKSPKNSKGFRRFQLGAAGPQLKVLHVDDLSATSVFEQASNRPAILFLEKGAPTIYPVPYATWEATTRQVDSEHWTTWSDAASTFEIRLEQAQPVDANDRTSSWVHAPESVLKSYHAIAGVCPYRARTGVFTGGANGVFYLQRLCSLANGNLLVKNIVERTRRITPALEVELEPTFIYPFLRGRDVDSWHASVDSNRLILCPHTRETGMKPVGPKELERIARKTYSYFLNLRDVLEARQGFAGFDRDSFAAGFYTLLRIGDYTFKPFKVVWRYISKTFKCCVVEPAWLGGRLVPVLPQEKLMLIGFNEPLEAYYVCGMLSSTPIRSAIESRMVGTQISASVIEHIGIPKFDANNARHIAIADACRRGHKTKLNVNTELDFIDEQVSALMSRVRPALAATTR